MQISTLQERNGPRVVAVLGPTNTGKTYLALERMMAHSSGMIGFPLRLLARENYDRVVKLKGAASVALITGEEKIVPPNAKYFLCTVESMPLERQVSFLAIDEVQLCADADRGHIFTDRLLHARGMDETMFMGASTVRSLLTKLVENVHIETRPRFSTLSYTGPKKVTRLPSRSAVVAFSAADVYALAEMVRRQKGGAAVVLGALSPRTRNAQVGMFQAGEVDYLVATDAIGMGLNMDVNHVAFASLQKFDGRNVRRLNPQEMAQIAGRAGRHMNDGTFGTTADGGNFGPEEIDCIENHNFDRIKQLYWRNSNLGFTSIDHLKASLAVSPTLSGLIKAREADDHLALIHLCEDEEVTSKATNTKAIELLWEVCRVPDFGRTLTDSHTNLMRRIYGYLMASEGTLPTDWVAEHVKRLDRTDGDIDTLSQRIANIRTWTYVSHRSGWIKDQDHWQNEARKVEDSLSDALHERLTQRFVDQRTSILLRRMRNKEKLLVAVKKNGEVLVEGHFVGKLEGFRFAVDDADNPNAAKAVSGVSMQALQQEIETRLMQFETEEDKGFSINPEGMILWGEAPVAKLTKGADALSPQIEVLPSDLLEAPGRDKIKARLEKWLPVYFREKLLPLMAARDAQLTGAAKGIAFEICLSLGSLPRNKVRDQLNALTREERRDLRQIGMRIGRICVHMPLILKPAAARLCLTLWSLYEDVEGPLPEVAPGLMSVKVDPAAPDGFYEILGYRKAGTLAVRLDMLERIAGLAFDMTVEGPAVITPDLLSLAGTSIEVMAEILRSIGYMVTVGEEETKFEKRKRKPKPKPKPEVKKEAAQKLKPKREQKPRQKKEAVYDPHSPFAVLKDLQLKK
ncbi:MAG: helicase-related protein [Rhodospirillales bacterium]|nr:helicase-related protein [Rhodospirillales bacterium]